MNTLLAATVMISVSASCVFADRSLSVQFRESAPKDSFILSNSGNCDLNIDVTIDLEYSAGKLIFDTTNSGAGVEVFQPFEVVSGAANLKNQPNIIDGDKAVQLMIQGLGINETVAFTIDVDDTLPQSDLGQIRVAGSEIVGAQVTVAQYDQGRGYFGADGQAVVALGACATS